MIDALYRREGRDEAREEAADRLARAPQERQEAAEHQRRGRASAEPTRGIDVRKRLHASRTAAVVVMGGS